MCVCFLSPFRIASVQCLRQEVPDWLATSKKIFLISPMLSLRDGALHQHGLFQPFNP